MVLIKVFATKIYSLWVLAKRKADFLFDSCCKTEKE